jgi:4-hydroxybutyryl-CoA dehydratase/vinylacetyl-CoA-Delta-isomerase
MHGGGSPDGARIVINSKTDIDHYIDLARRLADIKEKFQIESKIKK